METGNRSKLRGTLLQSDLFTAKAKMLTTNHILSTLSSRPQAGGVAVDLRPSLKLQTTQGHMTDIGTLPNHSNLINWQLQKPMGTGLLTNKQLMVNTSLMVGDSLTNKLLTTRKLRNLETPLCSTVGECGNRRLPQIPVTRSTHLERHKSLLNTCLTTSMKKSQAVKERPTLSISRKNKENTTIQQKQSKTRPEIEMPESDFQMPQYEMLMSEFEELEEAADEFVPQDESLARHVVDDPQQMKVLLINAVSASLIRAPDFKNKDDMVRQQLLHLADKVTTFDSEFVLKVALYTRCELNIRTTANFLLAYAANRSSCRCYLQRYFKSSVRLPSDWIDVAGQYMTFRDKSMTSGALPAALRRAMVAKFVDFDKYQLAKYNKESSRKKETKQRKKRIIQESDSDSSDYGSDSDDSLETAHLKSLHRKQKVSASSEQSEPEDVSPTTFTLKMLIRKLHITEPVEHVMCLIGKKYPSSFEEFSRSRLPGMFDEQLAGKRMKLPTPETWETQVSLKGNKASTWETLIDNRKLPFMAMLRNLRNMIKAGVSEKHHRWVLRKLTDEGAVINSRQFPFRFFSAYTVLEDMEKVYEKNQSSIINSAIAQQAELSQFSSQDRGRRGQGRGGRGQGRGGRGRGGRQRPSDPNQPLPELEYDPRILVRYRKALDTAVMIATANNVEPIRGTTVVYCDVSSSANIPCMSARGLGNPRTVAEITVLLALMFKYASEHSQVIVYGDSGYQQVELEVGTILNNMTHVMAMQKILNKSSRTGDARLPERHLMEFLTSRTQIDNLIVLSIGLVADDVTMLAKFNSKFRQLVNSDLLFVNVNVGGSLAVSPSDVERRHENDVDISGFSDQILRFVAERGNNGQLMHVENIDVAYSLKPLPEQPGKTIQQQEIKHHPERPLTITSCAPRWRTVRVFISSTFRDMHGERDLLTRFVFPELRARSRKQFVNVVEIDMRWGMTEKDAKSNRILELCLREAARCQMFVGMLGERYGSIPSRHALPDSPEFDWVREYPRDASITELEMHLAALSKSSEVQDKVFFYLRDNAFMCDIPKQWKTDFATENLDAVKKLANLKDQLLTSGLEVYESYPCHWGGVAEGKPVVAGLEAFGQRVLANLSNAISTLYPTDVAALDDISHDSAQHDAFMASLQQNFTGRKLLLKQCLQRLCEMSSGVIVLSGKSGVGKSALMAALEHEYVESAWCACAANVLVHFVGATPASTSISAVIRRLCHELVHRFNLNIQLAEDYKNLQLQFGSILRDAALHCDTPLVIFIDGLDLLSEDHEAHQLHWIPDSVPENVIIVMSCQSDTRCHQRLCHRDNTIHLKVGQLDRLEKSDVAREMLSVHRKQLDESPFNNQMKLLTSKREADSPLFLQLACEELRVFGVFEKVNEKLKILPQTLSQLLQVVLTRLEKDIGEDSLVSTALALLVSTRNDLSEEDLHMLLSYNRLLDSHSAFCLEDVRNISLGPNQRLAPALLCQLISAIRGFLRPFTSDGTANLSLAHATVRSAIWQRYLKPSGGKMEIRLHTLMAGYYYTVADEKRDGSWRGNSPQAFRELPYHLACAGCFKELESILCNLSFISAKCRIAMATDLLGDYLTAGLNPRNSPMAQKKFASSERVQQYHAFVSRNVNILHSCPSLLWQLAINEPRDTAPAQDVSMMLENSSPSSHMSLMELLNKPSLTDPCLLTLANLSHAATCVALSADGQLLVCGSRDCSVRVYHTATGKEMRSFQGHADEVTDVCFVGANRLCSASLDGTLSLWDTHIGHRVTVIKAHRRRVSACVTDPSARVIASTSWDGTVKFWRARDGQPESDLPSRGCPVNCVSFHPDGQSVVTGSWDAALCIWDVSTRKRKAVLRGHSSSVRSVAFSPSGEHIASASLDGEVKLWTAASGTQIGNLNCHTRPINSLTFSPSGDHLITVSDDQKVKIWSGQLGRNLRTLGGQEDSPALSLSLHPGGETVAVGYHDGQVRMFDCLTGALFWEMTVHSAPVNCVRFNRTGTHLLTGSQDSTAKILKAKANRRGQSEVLSTFDHNAPVLATAHGDRVIAATCEDSTAFLYSVQCKDETYLSNLFQEQQQQQICQQQQTCQQQQISQPQNGQTSPLAELVGHDDAVTACSFNSNETKLVTTSRDRCIFIWDVPYTAWGRRSVKLQPTHSLRECHADWINDCAWSNTSDFIVTGSNDCNLKMWNVKKEQEKACLTGHTSTVNSLGFSYGCIVTGSSDSTVKVWSHKGSLITTLRGHRSRVNSCDLHVTVTVREETTTDSSDWATMMEEDEWRSEHEKARLDKTMVKVKDVVVASCCDDGTVQLWQPLQSDQLACLTGHSDRVVSVACSSKGVICTTALDRTVKVWQPHLAAIDESIGHDAEVTSLACSPGGAWAVSASRDCCIKLWKSDSCQQALVDKTLVGAKVPSCQLTVKAHSKAVTAVCFIAVETFVSGSDDASLSTWTISNIHQRPIVRKLHHRTTTSAVTYLVYTPEGTTLHGVISSHWDGTVCIHDDNLNVLTTLKPHSDSILTCAFAQLHSSQVFITGCVDETVAFTNWADNKTSTCLIPHNVAEDKGRPRQNWICCMAVNTGCGTVYVGDSHGQLSMLQDGKVTVTKKIHSARVTSCVFSQDILFTASLDGSIKIWTANLRQIGQFFCASAVMTMVATPSDQHQRLMCGDRLGNVIYLKWIN